MPADLPDHLYLFGRLLLGGLFVVGGIEHFFIQPVLTGIMAGRGVPAARSVLILGSIWQVIFGLLFIFGIVPALSALALAVFTALASLIFLDFWNKQQPERSALRNALLCNIAIIGALFMAAASAL
ncbi:DoxX family protein [Mesorhizobium sp. VNQ89]|uniref:DoxX family protein n=1 Tax=Mesorhizobium quangtriensis TaxID=3157709 RepID=UPI0032B86D41